MTTYTRCAICDEQTADDGSERCLCQRVAAVIPDECPSCHEYHAPEAVPGGWECFECGWDHRDQTQVALRDRADVVVEAWETGAIS